MSVSDIDRTMTFSVGAQSEEDIKRILTTVYEALLEKGYNPINQIVGYLLSEDPTYITSYRNARALIRKIDRDDFSIQWSKSILVSDLCIYYNILIRYCKSFLSESGGGEQNGQDFFVNIIKIARRQGVFSLAAFYCEGGNSEL